MSLSTPPAPTDDSCWSSPMRRTEPPRAMTKSTTLSRLRVSAIPASSMTTRLAGPMAAAHSGSSPRAGWSRCQVSLAIVSVVALMFSPSTSAAAAEGARPITVPPPSVQACARALMAVVLPAPAGAMASCRRAPEVAISRTRVACPALRGSPLAVEASMARSTAPAGTLRPSYWPARATIRASAARSCGEVKRAEPAIV